MKQRKRRLLSNLRTVKVVDKAPGFLTRGRRSASQAAGIYYERKVAEYFEAHFGEDKVIHGPWLHFEDDEGHGWCQPDLIVWPPHRTKIIWVGECKLKASKEAEERLINMYIPCVSMLYPKHKIVGVQFCRHLKGISQTKHQHNLIGYEELLDMKNYTKPFYTINLRRVY